MQAMFGGTFVHLAYIFRKGETLPFNLWFYRFCRIEVIHSLKLIFMQETTGLLSVLETDLVSVNAPSLSKKFRQNKEKGQPNDR